MALLGSAASSEVGLRLLLSPLGSNVVIRTACCSIGIVLPVYNTFKAIETNNPNEQHKWLVYWAVYGSFSVAEIFADKILSWFPLYYHVKFAFLVWLQLPSADGAMLLYTRHLRPFLLRHQEKLDGIAGFTYNEMMVKLIQTARKTTAGKINLKRRKISMLDADREGSLVSSGGTTRVPINNHLDSDSESSEHVPKNPVYTTDSSEYTVGSSEYTPTPLMVFAHCAEPTKRKQEAYLRDNFGLPSVVRKAQDEEESEKEEEEEYDSEEDDDDQVVEVINISSDIDDDDD